jgi:phage shock protein C
MEHTNPKNGPYKSRNKMIAGVCAGIAEHFGISSFWIRLLAVVALFMTGIWPTVIIYLIAAIIMKPAPARPFDSEEESEFYDAYVSSPKYTIRQVHEKFKNLDRRIQRMEDTVTARAYEWEQKLNT